MAKPPPLAIDELDTAIRTRLIGTPMGGTRRLLGVEYERLILRRTDSASAPIGFCVDLMRELVAALGGEPVVDDGVLKGLVGDGFAMSMEPGGQLEVAVQPCTTLAEIDVVIGAVSAVIERALSRTDYALQCVGHAPVTPVERIGLLPRPRYEIMDRVMPPRGALSRNMMRATAGFQLTYDVVDVADAARKLALLFRLTPVLLALTANSRQVAGADSGYASFRHRVWLDTDSQRTGVPDGCLDAGTALDGYVAFARRAHVMFLVRDGHLVPAPDRSLEQLTRDGAIGAADLDAHLTGLFPFVRLRNYIEVRCFDSVPWDHARSVLALVSGVVYCPGATARAEQLSAMLAVRDRAALRQLQLDAARAGLDARAGGATLREIAHELIRVAAETLGRESCGWAEASDLDVVRRFAAPAG